MRLNDNTPQCGVPPDPDDDEDGDDYEAEDAL
jgi:hypothetical protein